MSAIITLMCFVVWLPVIVGTIVAWSALKGLGFVVLQIFATNAISEPPESFVDYLVTTCFNSVGVLLQGIGAFALNVYSSLRWCWLEVSSDSISAILLVIVGLNIHIFSLQTKRSSRGLSYFEGYTFSEHFGYSIILVFLGFTLVGFLSSALLIIALILDVVWSSLTGNLPFTEHDFNILGGGALLLAFLGFVMWLGRNGPHNN